MICSGNGTLWQLFWVGPKQFSTDPSHLVPLIGHVALHPVDLGGDALACPLKGLAICIYRLLTLFFIIGGWSSSGVTCWSRNWGSSVIKV